MHVYVYTFYGFLKARNELWNDAHFARGSPEMGLHIKSYETPITRRDCEE
jgi:hypothetical protein